MPRTGTRLAAESRDVPDCVHRLGPLGDGHEMVRGSSAVGASSEVLFRLVLDPGRSFPHSWPKRGASAGRATGAGLGDTDLIRMRIQGVHSRRHRGAASPAQRTGHLEPEEGELLGAGTMAIELHAAAA